MRLRLVMLAIVVLVAGCDRRDDATSILLITLDTLRTDHVGSYGSAADLTPNLDALAHAGIVHDAAYTTMPTTAPAHVSLFTGLPPHRHGVLRNGAPLDPALHDRELGARLHAAGYATAAFVTTRLLDRSVTGLSGFEIYDGPPGTLRPGSEAVTAALRWLDVERRRPVFLWLHFYDAHAPYGHADEKLRGLPLDPSEYGFVDPARYADPRVRSQHREAYQRGVRDADDALGAIVAGVRARIQGPLLIAAVADHGEALDEWLDTRHYGFDHGEFLDPDQIRIPLVLAGPGVAPGRSGGAVSISDPYGTLLAAAGVGVDAPLRDLRLASADERVVLTERRAGDAAEAAAEPRTAAALRAHSVAATDGRGFAVIAADGSSTDVAPEALLEAGRAALAELPQQGAVAAPEVDAATREALRSLGYTD
jgi:arylsulfatase A-like enzyme